MEEATPKKTVFPDRERELMARLIAGKKWRNCPNCDWFYNQNALSHCPMCHYEWSLGPAFDQPPYEPTVIA